jgi:hypothetical protein
MLAVMSTNGTKKQLEDWSHIQWQKANKLVRNLRQRIFRARKLGNFKTLRSLQKLMQRSYANLLLSVRPIAQCFVRTSMSYTGRDIWVLEADIRGFFDNIAHESILTLISNFPKRNLIQGWLKAGFVFDGKFNPTEMGTPQGGVISPLLANIGLHGLETYLKSTNPKLGVVRYADDFIVTARDKGSLEIAQVQIQQWLSARGLELRSEKTFITSMEDGNETKNTGNLTGLLVVKNIS